MSFANKLPSWAPLPALMLCLIGVFFAYQLGFSGALYYDDLAPLARLASVEDLGSALYFAFSNSSGPLGRPIALASFLVHAQDWPDNTAAIFRFNALIHLANGLLVAGIALILLRLMRGRTPGNAWLATGAAALWLALPLQVSTSLIAIQRMTGLSAFFVFSGLLVYLQGLSAQSVRPRLALVLQGVGLGLFTLLAMFTKENGALLPVFAWLIEFTLLAQCATLARWRTIRLTILSTALLAILGYLAYTALNAEATYLNRPFTLAERLTTEPQILMEYLRLALFPRVLAFNPFHDGYVHITTLTASPVALLSLVVWVAMLIAVVLWRRRVPMLAFAVLWFLAGHLLESTVIGLELYYEHRNYVALFGPCLALVWLIGRLSVRYPRMAPTTFVIYLVVQVLMLAQVTSLWGDRVLAAEMWAMHNPTSARATAHLAGIYNNEQTDPGTALRIIDRRLTTCSTCLPLAIQAVVLSCQLEPAERVRSRLAHIGVATKSGFVFSAGAVESLQGVHDLVKRGACPAISWPLLEGINRTLLENRFFQASSRSEGLHVNLHNIYREQGEYSRAMDELQSAWQIKQSHGLAYPMVDLWLTQKMFQEATNFADHEMCRELPRNPILAHAATERCKSVQNWIQKAQPE